ncbi:MAG: glutaredoxin 3 [Pseudomonadota bacterium]
MARVLMYSARLCGYCQMAERLLVAKGVTEIDKVLVDAVPERRAEMIARSGRTSVPQIFIGDTHVGGYSELAALDRQGQLDELLARP